MWLHLPQSRLCKPCPAASRMRPDGEMYYDGVSITPYETVFIPVSLGYVQNGWSFVNTAAKYEEWLTAQVGLRVWGRWG